jgi:hypothetical protein
VVYDDPRFKAFEDSNHFLNTAVLQTQGPCPDWIPQVGARSPRSIPDLPVIDFKSLPPRWMATLRRTRCWRS